MLVDENANSSGKKNAVKEKLNDQGDVWRKARQEYEQKEFRTSPQN